MDRLTSCERQHISERLKTGFGDEKVFTLRLEISPTESVRHPKNSLID